MSNAPDALAEATVVADIEAWDAIEDHRTGTAGDRATDDWLAGHIARLGLEPHLEVFPFERVVVHAAFLEVGPQRIDGVPMFDGGGTGQPGVTGRLGRDIVCLPCAPADGHPATLELLAARRETQARALVALSAADGVEPGLALLNAESYREPFGPPVLQVGSDHRDFLQAQTAAEAAARCVVDTAREHTQAANVTTTIAGSDPGLRPAVVMTPKSAWWTCTAERVGGVCVWLALLRHFAQHAPARTLIFTANTGHELSHLGLDEFLARNPALGAELWLHLGANFASVGSSVRVQASSQALLDALTGHLTAAGLAPATATPVGTRPLGEARNVFDAGQHYLSILGSNRFFHQPADRWPRSVDVERTLAAVRGSVALMTELVGA